MNAVEKKGRFLLKMSLGYQTTKTKIIKSFIG